IVCTLGPNSEAPEQIESLISAGLDVVRQNFSHGDYDFHRTILNRVRAAAGKLGKPIAVMQDLQGPKIRCGKMEGGLVMLEPGQKTIITTDEILGTAARFPTSYKLLPRDVQKGDPILLDDGNLTLQVLSVQDTEVHCEVIDGGPLKDKKGINLPRSKVSAPSMTPKDIRDAHFGAEAGFDAVALSFVRSRHDVRMLRRELAQAKSRPLIIAKLEKPQAIEQLEGILDEADGVMVARGDRGVEMPPEQVPMIQKTIVEEANRRGKIVIVATQMLESMITNPRPTRAEASDVANAVLDGADAVMLSGETAVGRNPAGVVQMMERIVVSAEQSHRAKYARTTDFLATHGAQDFQNAVSLAAVRATKELGAQAIVVYYTSGSTARLVSDYRPQVPILALVPDAEHQRRLAFAWGVQTATLPPPRSPEELFAAIDAKVEECRIARPGDTVVVVSKVPLTSNQRTNSLHLYMVGTAAAMR
ncbi:MAG: pyruvate kinase, partial [Myxococcota bacterium]